MATLDPFNVLQQQEHTPIPTAPSPKVDVPNGTPSMWQRIQQVGIGKVNLLNAGRMAKATAISTGKAAIGAGEDISNAIGNTEVRVGAKLGIKAKTGTQTPTQQFGKKAGSYAGTTAKEKIGNIAQTALLGLPGGGKAVEVTAADLLKTFGTQGVRDLADKAGVDIGGKGAIEGAKAVAGTKVAQQAFKKATTNVVTKTVKTSAKSAAGFGAFSAAGEASAGGSNKQIVKAGEQGAVIGAVAGGLASGARSIAKAKSGNAAVEGVTKGKAPSEGPSPVTKLEAKATARQKADQALAPPKTKLLGPGSGKAEGKGFTMSSSPDANKVKISARLNAINKQLDAHAQGIKVLPADQLKALVAEKDSLTKEASSPPPATTPKIAEGKATSVLKDSKPGQGTTDLTSVTTPGESKVKVTTPKMDESGGVAPGAVSKDIQDYLAKNQKVNQATGDIKRDSQIHENAQKQRLIDSASLLKKVKGYSNFDKTAVYNYREAKAAGTDLPKLNARQQALHNIVTEIVRATNQNKSELAKLKAPGYSEDKIFDPESGNHRMAVGKGSSFERFLGGAQRTPLGARSLRTTTSSSKARVWYAITDKEGNRSVAAIKNVSIKQGMRNVPKGKFVDRIEEQGASTRLGKITPQELKDGSFKGRDGNTYTVSQATSEEISKATHQEYFRNPLVNAVIDYHETASALDSARMLEKWKGSEDFHNIAMKIGEGTPPRKWTTTKLPQMQGYHFEPKVAETLDDIYGRIQNKNDVLSAVNHLLKQTMVAVPIRHNLNELGFYFTDRGLSGMINPFKIYRGSANLVKAFNSVMNMDENYRTVMSSGFNFMYHDDKAFSDQINNQMKSMLDDTKISARLAGDLGIPVQRLRSAWNAIQHKGVWFQQDVLNMARIYDRAGKNGDLISAANETQRFNPQYRVPSRVAGSRSASIILRNNNILFFGSYHYDQWKVLANILGDLSGRNGIKGAAQSVDKLAALSLGVWATQALVDKGLQKISGDPNAYTKAPGVLDLPQQLYQLATGQKDISTFAQSQLFPSIGLSTVAQVFENRDFFTGKSIRDANTAPSDQVKQLGKWLESQLPTSQQVQNVKKSGNVTAGVLALSGARFPKNSPQVNDLNSLKYDTLPNVQSVAKKQAQAGDISGAQKTISQYDKLVLNATKNALKTAGKPVPSDNSLIKQLIKQQYYYAPKSATIKKWSTEKQTSVLDRIK